MFRAGFVQFRPVRYDVQANIETLDRLLDGVQADLLVLPELSNSGYLYASPEELAPFGEPAGGAGPFLSALRGLAQRTGGMLVAGFCEQAGGVLYNSAAAVDPDGIRQVYRKSHLFLGEKSLFQPGDTGFQVLEFRGVTVGMMICYDWYFPESARTLALKGAQIIAHPSDLVLPHGQQGMIVRSLENRVFSITPNRYGEESTGDTSLRFTGASQLVNPLGVVLARAPVEGDHVEICEIDPAQASDKHATHRNDLFLDRRTDLYELD